MEMFLANFHNLFITIWNAQKIILVKTLNMKDINNRIKYI